ncbi:MAG: 23S rRNA (adenine(2503)-C(2))-methyltransferase RlmN [Deltaproteobacteria bacterium]|nr:23S rRNA (adenine(2503)-C(2))-methyltransferase RlmN [Deltaproteobacteria bacterium]
MLKSPPPTLRPMPSQSLASPGFGLETLEGGFDPFSLPYLALEERVVALGGSPVHARGWFRALHRTGEADPGQVPNLGVALAVRLRAALRPALPRLSHQVTSPDGTIKLRLELADGLAVEAVLIPEGERLTLCLSAQAGCAVGCGFCATATLGLARNLSAGEIVGQWRLARKVAERPITNVVFMGMGEPLHNWFAVRDAIAIFNDQAVWGLSRRRITVSTSGVLPRMAAPIRDAGVALALSLHHTRQEERAALIPLARRYPLPELMAELRRLVQEERAVVMVQYLLLKGENDSLDHADELAALTGGFPCHVNLLTYNAVPGLPFDSSEPQTLLEFRNRLRAAGIHVGLRQSRGGDIASACGQLAPKSEPPWAP